MNVEELAIGKHSMYIIEDAISNEMIESFYNYTQKLPFLKQERDNDEDEYPSFSADLKPKLFETQSPLGKIGREIISSIYPDKDYILFRVAVNLMTRGDMEIPHYDCLPHRDDVTLLYYVNNVWSYEWGGETLFYLDKDTHFGILPKPGRFVLFPGIIEHKSGIPSRTCKKVRYTLALKYASRSNFKKRSN
ncbi:2OG-Fe(II) oxygenase [Sinomicrobium oceani]|uniref:2OG-Fe(II) oxygenase n=1 Tax=Sinomicrobium oceani TaxID=1150368 RepID=UPI002279FD41|nr:2OG-Fe(II) oxygenase [Sinomicrobium oceani]